jgi:hypothetical protein
MTTYASTFLSMKNEVKDKLRLDTDTDDDSRLGEWLNQTLVRVATESKYFESNSDGSALAANATNQALPATLVELEYITRTYGGQTVYLTPSAFETILELRATGATGPPTQYALRKSTVEFWPNAQGGEVLTYYGAGLPSLMSADGDTTGLPEPFASKLIVYGACIEAADFKNDMRLYFYYQTAFAQWLEAFNTYLNTRLSRASRAFPIYGPDGRPFSAGPFLPHDPSSDFYVTGWRS